MIFFKGTATGQSNLSLSNLSLRIPWITGFGQQYPTGKAMTKSTHTFLNAPWGSTAPLFGEETSALTKRIAHIYITRPRRCQVLNPSVQEASAATRDPIDNVRTINSSSSLSLTLTALGNSFIKYFLNWDLVIILTTRQFPCPFIHILLQFNLGWYTSIPLNLGPSPWGQGRGVSTNLGPPVGQP